MKILVLLFLLLWSMGTVFSQESYEDYEFLASAQSVVIQNTELLRLDFQNKLVDVLIDRPELLTNDDPTQLIEAIEVLTSQGLPNKVKLKFSQAVRKPIINIAHEIRTIFRKHGPAIGIAYGALSITGYVVPAILVAVGQPQFAAILGSIPIATIFLVTVVSLKKVVNYSKMVKLYGGKENYHYYKRLHKQVNQSLQLKGKNHLIVPVDKISESEYSAVVITNSNIFSKFLSLVHHRRERLDFKQLKYFLDRNEAFDEILLKIKSSDATEELKLASMLYHIQISNPALYVEIQAAFRKNFIKIPKFEFTQGLKDWSLAAVHSLTKQELEETAYLIPVGSRVLDVVKIWVKCIVPRLIQESKGFSNASYLSLSRSLLTLEIAAEITPAKLVDENWKNDFHIYIQSTLNP